MSIFSCIADVVAALDYDAALVASNYKESVARIGDSHVEGVSATMQAALTVAGHAYKLHIPASAIEGDARNLPADLRQYHLVLTGDLKERGHSAPNMFWKRVKKKAIELLDAQIVADERAAAAAQGLEYRPEPEQVESEREKVRRMTEENIQSMYSRIYKAKDCDTEVTALLPVLVDMAESLGFTLVVPSAK